MNYASPYLAKFLLRVRPAFVASLIKGAIGVQRSIIETPNGRFLIDPISNFGFRLSNDACYEPQVESALHTYLGPGKVFIDLGANEGYFTVLAAKLCGPRGHVLAIEPQTRLLPLINENLRLNCVKAELLNAAISDSRGSAILHLAPSVNTGGSGLHKSTRYRVGTQRIETMTLAAVIAAREFQQVDLLKIDIEGSEYEAIIGSPDLFRNKIIKTIALELHPNALAKRGKSASEILAFLKDAGYKPAPEFPSLVWVSV
jgi:FkbM family methyltransferase